MSRSVIMAPPIMENRIVFMRDSVSAIHHAAVDGVASTYQVEACEQLVRALQANPSATKEEAALFEAELERAGPSLVRDCLTMLSSSSTRSPSGTLATLKALGSVLGLAETVLKQAGPSSVRLVRDVLSSLVSRMNRTQDRNVLNLCAWCVEQQRLPLGEALAKSGDDAVLPQLLKSLVFSITSSKTASCALRETVARALHRLFAQAPRHLCAHAASWMPEVALLEVDTTLAFWNCAHTVESGQAGICGECRACLQNQAGALLDAAAPMMWGCMPGKEMNALGARMASMLVQDNDRALLDLGRMSTAAGREFAALRAWGHIMTLAGPALDSSSYNHAKSSKAVAAPLLVNRVLKTPAHLFVSKSADLRAACHRAWRRLISVFARLYGQGLSPRRLKLVMKPLAAELSPSSPYNLAFDPTVHAEATSSWCRLVKATGANLPNVLSEVVLPVLQVDQRAPSQQAPDGASVRPVPVPTAGWVICLRAFTQQLSLMCCAEQDDDSVVDAANDTAPALAAALPALVSLLRSMSDWVRDSEGASPPVPEAGAALCEFWQALVRIAASALAADAAALVEARPAMVPIPTQTQTDSEAPPPTAEADCTQHDDIKLTMSTTLPGQEVGPDEGRDASGGGALQCVVNELARALESAPSSPRRPPHLAADAVRDALAALLRAPASALSCTSIALQWPPAVASTIGLADPKASHPSCPAVCLAGLTCALARRTVEEESLHAGAVALVPLFHQCADAARSLHAHPLLQVDAVLKILEDASESTLLPPFSAPPHTQPPCELSLEEQGCRLGSSDPSAAWRLLQLDLWAGLAAQASRASVLESAFSAYTGGADRCAVEAGVLQRLLMFPLRLEVQARDVASLGRANMGTARAESPWKSLCTALCRESDLQRARGAARSSPAVELCTQVLELVKAARTSTSDEDVDAVSEHKTINHNNNKTNGNVRADSSVCQREGTWMASSSVFRCATHLVLHTTDHAAGARLWEEFIPAHHPAASTHKTSAASAMSKRPGADSARPSRGSCANATRRPPPAQLQLAVELAMAAASGTVLPCETVALISAIEAVVKHAVSPEAAEATVEAAAPLCAKLLDKTNCCNDSADLQPQPQEAFDHHPVGLEALGACVGSLWETFLAGPAALTSASTSTTSAATSDATSAAAQSLLVTLEPALVAGFAHSSSTISNATLRFWNASFAVSPHKLQYPDRLKERLTSLCKEVEVIAPGLDLPAVAEVAKQISPRTRGKAIALAAVMKSYAKTLQVGPAPPCVALPAPPAPPPSSPPPNPTPQESSLPGQPAGGRVTRSQRRRNTDKQPLARWNHNPSAPATAQEASATLESSDSAGRSLWGAGKRKRTPVSQLAELTSAKPAGKVAHIQARASPAPATKRLRTEHQRERELAQREAGIGWIGVATYTGIDCPASPTGAAAPGDTEDSIPQETEDARRSPSPELPQAEHEMVKAAEAVADFHSDKLTAVTEHAPVWIAQTPTIEHPPPSPSGQPARQRVARRSIDNLSPATPVLCAETWLAGDSKGNGEEPGTNGEGAAPGLATSPMSPQSGFPVKQLATEMEVEGGGVSVEVGQSPVRAALVESASVGLGTSGEEAALQQANDEEDATEATQLVADEASVRMNIDSSNTTDEDRVLQDMKTDEAVNNSNNISNTSTERGVDDDENKNADNRHNINNLVQENDAFLNLVTSKNQGKDFNSAIVAIDSTLGNSGAADEQEDAGAGAAVALPSVCADESKEPSSPLMLAQQMFETQPGAQKWFNSPNDAAAATEATTAAVACGPLRCAQDAGTTPAARKTESRTLQLAATEPGSETDVHGPLQAITRASIVQEQILSLAPSPSGGKGKDEEEEGQQRGHGFGVGIADREGGARSVRDNQPQAWEDAAESQSGPVDDEVRHMVAAAISLAVVTHSKEEQVVWSGEKSSNDACAAALTDSLIEDASSASPQVGHDSLAVARSASSQEHATEPSAPLSTVKPVLTGILKTSASGKRRSNWGGSDDQPTTKVRKVVSFELPNQDQEGQPWVPDAQPQPASEADGGAGKVLHVDEMDDGCFGNRREGSEAEVICRSLMLCTEPIKHILCGMPNGAKQLWKQTIQELNLTTLGDLASLTLERVQSTPLTIVNIRRRLNSFMQNASVNSLSRDSKVLLRKGGVGKRVVPYQQERTVLRSQAPGGSEAADARLALSQGPATFASHLTWLTESIDSEDLSLLELAEAQTALSVLSTKLSHKMRSALSPC